MHLAEVKQPRSYCSDVYDLVGRITPGSCCSVLPFLCHEPSFARIIDALPGQYRNHHPAKFKADRAGVTLNVDGREPFLRAY